MHILVQSGIKTTNFDVGFNWLMLAGNRYMRKPGSKVEGFGGFMLGAAFINVDNPDNGILVTVPQNLHGASGSEQIFGHQKEWQLS